MTPLASACVALLALASGFPVPAAPRDDARVHSSASIVRHFLESAPPGQAARVRLPFDAPDRTWWERSPAPRPGLPVGEMSPRERKILDHLIESVLSPRGAARVRAVMAEQDRLGTEEGIGSDWYWFAVYGDPFADDRWSWRLGGHHVSLHFTYAGRHEIVSVTPFFLGGERAETAGSAEATALGARVAAARALAAALSDAASSEAWLGSSLPEPIAESARRAGFPRDPRGVAVADLPHALVDALVDQFLEDVESEYLGPARRLAQDPSGLRFAWAGSLESAGPFYARLLGRRFLLEVWIREGHLHSILSTTEDFGSRGTGGAPAGR